MKSKKAGWLLSFLKIGLIGFGGGTSLIPVIQQEMVENRKLVSKDDYDSDVIVASITPGALPVEISGCIGKRFAGARGMLLAALCIALPGSLATVILLSCMSVLDQSVLTQIELVAIGISAFIISMLTGYIKNAFKWAKEHDRLFIAIGIVLGVLVLNSGKSIFKVLGLFGIEGSPFLSISTVDILVVTFFVLLFTKCKFTIPKIIISTVLVIPYVLCVSKAHLIDNIYVLRSIQFIMLGLSCYGILSDDKDRKSLKKKVPVKPLIKEELAWLIFFVSLCTPAFFVYPEFLDFIGRGFVSSIISFGGGDAYLTVADSMFVSEDATATMISDDSFYSQIVTLVNVLPGSILCKTLTAVGYELGFQNGGGVLRGYLVALAGFVCSIVGSCSVVSLVQYFFKKIENFRVFEILKNWIKVIISGLLGSVILSLIFSSLKVTQGQSELTLIFALAELVGIYILNLVLVKFTKINAGLRVLISSILALIIGNIII
ncbi:MAG: chromate transporter [Oscillospiraceae bacterium]|nr:chromate transporter [Oscillospiraceae bacterium]